MSRFVTWLLWDLWVGLWELLREPELKIDLKRVNAEDCTARRLTLDEDVEYRTRVKRRMAEGLTSQQLAPLVNVRLYSTTRKTHRRRNVIPIIRKEA